MSDFGYFNMDCMDGMKKFPDNFFDIAVCDPQYGLKQELVKDRGSYAKQRNGSRIWVDSEEYDMQDWDGEAPGPEYFQEILRVSKNQIIFGCNYFNFPLQGGELCGISAMTAQTRAERKLPTAVLMTG